MLEERKDLDRLQEIFLNIQGYSKPEVLEGEKQTVKIIVKSALCSGSSTHSAIN